MTPEENEKIYHYEVMNNRKDYPNLHALEVKRNWWRLEQARRQKVKA